MGRASRHHLHRAASACASTGLGIRLGAMKRILWRQRVYRLGERGYGGGRKLPEWVVRWTVVELTSFCIEVSIMIALVLSWKVFKFIWSLTY